MSFLKGLKRDYRQASDGWKEAKGDTKTAEEERKIMQKFAHDLVRTADAMEREQ